MKATDETQITVPETIRWAVAGTPRLGDIDNHARHCDALNATNVASDYASRVAGRTISGFNDHDAKSAKHVQKVLLQAAALAESEGN